MGILKILENLFKVLENKVGNSHRIVKVVLDSKTHPLFQAHFPNNEILAGFLQIDIIANILKHKIKKIKKAKFLSIIYPNDIIEYCIETKNYSNYKIVIKNQVNKKVSEFSYEI